MTAQDILLRLQKEPKFALQFAIDNNPDAVAAALKAAGFNTDGTRMGSFEVLWALMMGGKKDVVIKMISSIPYINSAPNYTGNLKDYFLRTSPPGSAPMVPVANGSKFSFDGLLAGLGVGLSTYVAASQTAAGTGNGSNADNCPKPEGSDCCENDEECLKKEKTRKMWMIIGIVGGSLLVIGIIAWALSRSGKEDKKES